MTLVLRYIARSDRGLVRSNNEDSVYAGARLLALADGMAAQALVTGYVEAGADGTITVGCHLYDSYAEEALAREGFRIPVAGWRRAAADRARGAA